MALEEVQVQGQVSFAGPNEVSLGGFSDARLVDTEVEESLDTRVQILLLVKIVRVVGNEVALVSVMAGGIRAEAPDLAMLDYLTDDTLDELLLVYPKDFKLELEEADLGRVSLGQLAHAVPVHVLKDALGQLDEKCVAPPGPREFRAEFDS